MRCEDFLYAHTWWLVLGRNKFSTHDYAWPVENSPPSEDPTLYDPDLDQHPDVPTWVVASSSGFVGKDIYGPIYFGGERWSFSSNQKTTDIYLKFEINPSVNTSMLGYRRISLRVDPVPKFPPIYYGTTNDFSDLGSIVFSSNEALILRPQNEIHVVEIVLPL